MTPGSDRWTSRLRLPSLVVLAIVLVVWEAVARRYGAYVMPSPRSVAQGLVAVVYVRPHVPVGEALQYVQSVLLVLGADRDYPDLRGREPEREQVERGHPGRRIPAGDSALRAAR